MNQQQYERKNHRVLSGIVLSLFVGIVGLLAGIWGNVTGWRIFFTAVVFLLGFLARWFSLQVDAQDRGLDHRYQMGKRKEDK